jgi:hypothetical protein
MSDKKNKTPEEPFSDDFSKADGSLGGHWTSVSSGTVPVTTTTSSPTWVSAGTTVYPSMTGTLTFGPASTAANDESKKEEPKRERRIVDFPRKVTKKVVIGFVEDDDTIVWSAKLKLLDFHVDFDNQDGEGRISLVTDIENAEEEPSA